MALAPPPAGVHFDRLLAACKRRAAAGGGVPAHERHNFNMAVQRLARYYDQLAAGGTEKHDDMARRAADLLFLKRLCASMEHDSAGGRLLATLTLPDAGGASALLSACTAAGGDGGDDAERARHRRHMKSAAAAQCSKALRRQLLGDYQSSARRRGGGAPCPAAAEPSAEQVASMHGRQQERLADEFLQLAVNLKHNVAATGSVIHDDNQRLDRVHKQADTNVSRLQREAGRLEVIARRACCDCGLVMLLAMVTVAFVAMVLFIRFFPKRAVY